MKKETYYCDRCKKQVDKKEDLSEVYIGWGHHYSDYRKRQRTYEICAKCEVKVGLARQVVKDDKIVNEPIKLEDKLFDVMAELVEFIQAQQ